MDYLAALEHSDGITKRQYQKDAAKIADVQKGILATSQNEEPFDVFICYKESDDATGQRTVDSTLAQDIYYQLTEEGYRVFFSRITLEDKVGTEYEPYIFAALNSAKVMVSIGTKPEHFNAVWVKNEWSRFLAMMRKDRSKLLLPCYRDMDPYDLPEQLSIIKYEGDNSTFVWKHPIEDFNYGSQLIVHESQEAIFFRDGQALDLFGPGRYTLETQQLPLLEKLYKLPTDTEGTFHSEVYYINKTVQMRFGDGILCDEISAYITHINDRNENNHVNTIYNDAKRSMAAADTEQAYKAVANALATIPGFEDADILAKQCIEKAESCRKDSIYASAKLRYVNSISGYEAAIELFRRIPGWKDADEQVLFCQQKIEEIEKKREPLINEQKRLNDLMANLNGFFNRDARKEVAARLAAIDMELHRMQRR